MAAPPETTRSSSPLGTRTPTTGNDAAASGERPSSGRAFTRRVFAGLAAGAVLAAGFPPYQLPCLLPLGVALLVAVLRNASPRGAAYAGLACGAVFFGGTLFWLGNLFGAAAVSLCAISRSAGAVSAAGAARAVGPRLPQRQE